MTDKERYATIGTWVRVFREEGVSVSDVTIGNRLKKFEAIGLTARLRTGQVMREGFYAESDVRRLCADLLQTLPQAGENGLVDQDGKSYGTIAGLGKLLGISEKKIQSRIRKSTLKPIRGKTKQANVRDFYSVSDIRNLCSDLLQDLPVADENGFFERNGETYGTIAALVRLLGISYGSNLRRIQESSLKPIRGKIEQGRVLDFYSLSGVRKFCSGLLQDLPQADEEGFIEQAGNTYGTIARCARLLAVSENAIRSRVRKSTLKPIRGKTKQANVRDFYSASDIRNLCSDLLQDLPQADDNGLIKQGGETYGMIEGLSRSLDISPNTIRRRIQKSPVKPLRGKMKGGQVCDFYPLSEVQQHCADLIAKKSKK